VRLEDPYLLAVLGVIPLLLWLKSRRSETPNAGAYSALTLLAAYQPTWRVRFRWLPTAVRALALILLVIALARPQQGQAESELPGQGIDIALVMDTSSSMTTTFGGGDSRLDVAQRVIDEFIAGRQNDRLALVIFRSQSLVLSPLTLDYAALRRLVSIVDSVNIQDSTAIGVGLSDALNLLRDSNARSRVAVLLTDGENNAGDIEPLAAARLAETLGIRVYTIGLVDQRARNSGNINVDETALEEMAKLAGGRYFAAENEEALASIYQSIDQLEKSRIGRPQFVAYDELAVYFLGAALALLALELALQATVWRRTA
jgi:Ca-activated chloride channel family protein